MPHNKIIGNDDGKELCEFLDRLGASEEIRQEHQKNGKELELLQTFVENLLLNCNGNSFIFGGWSEGTLLSNVYGSDIDLLICNNRHPVVTNPGESTPNDLYFMMIQDKSIKPGYVKLQPFVNKEALTDETAQKFHVNIHKKDCEGRLCLDHETAYRDFCYHKRNYFSKHGPAYTGKTHLNIPADIIPAFRCASVPFGSSWISDYKNCVWPSKAFIDNLVKLGCFFVPVGHIHSPQPELEWRVSFSLQERKIMFSLTPVQHKCYTSLKAVQHEVIEPLISDAISSYHLKTSIFHLKTLTAEEFWSQENFCICIRMCLLLLLSWLNRQFCPSWFIPEHNLFEKHVNLKNVERNILKKTLYSWVFKKNLTHFFKTSLDEFGLWPFYMGYRLMIKFTTLFRREEFRKCLYSANTTESKLTIEELYRWILAKLEKIPYLTSEWHSNDDCEIPRRSVTLLFKSVLLQTYGSLAWTNLLWTHLFDSHIFISGSLLFTETYLEYFNYSKDYGYWNDSIIIACTQLHGKKSGSYQNDRITSDTVLATILYMSRYYKTADLFLSRAESHDKKFDVYNVCECNIVPVYLQVFVTRPRAEEDILLQSAPCVIFTVLNLPIIPRALYFELIRTKVPVGTTEPCFFHEWHFWAVVDARIYLYFLRYLVFKELKKRNRQKEACTRMKRLIVKSERYGSNTNNTEYVWYCLGHIETALNLLGWIYVQEGLYDAAVYCFTSSWKKRRNINAAKWHMALLLFDTVV